MKKIILILGLIALPTFAQYGDVGTSLLVFRAGQVSLFQTGGNFFTGSFSWVPTYHLNNDFAIRLSLGGVYIKTKAGEKSAIGEYDLLVSKSFTEAMSVEIGGGGRYFISNGGNRWSTSANFVYTLNNPLLILFRHFYVGYTGIFVPTNFTHELRAGIGSSF